MYQQQIKKSMLLPRIAVVILLIYSLQVTNAFICPVNFCTNVDCATFPTEETCKGEIIPKSSACGCCSTCHLHIEEGGNCSELVEAILGPPPEYAYHCDHNLKCVNGKCVRG